ncbi:MAG: TIGR04076 family protein [Desulfobacteraceae bacterium]|jgi:uncharacterized repeat protein (TIGR04076 family)|nr:MAG: TIGR04076 family protein [Desulfobacteraceae bacterium]
MAHHPEQIQPLVAEVIDVRGECSAGHRKGEILTIGCYDSGGLCGFFYHDIFPALSIMQFGGKYPWAEKDTLILECPDKKNAVTVRIRRI